MPARGCPPDRIPTTSDSTAHAARDASHVSLGASLPPLRKAALALLLILPMMALWLAALEAPAGANGQTVSILDTTEGPYRVQVRVSPPTPRVGSLHMSVVLELQDDMLPVNDASVWVRAIGPAPDSLMVGPVNAEPTTALLNWYDLNIALPEEGWWKFELDIARGEDSTIVEFPVLVSSGSVNWGVVVVFIAALPLLVSAVWYFRRATAGRSARRPARRKR